MKNQSIKKQVKYLRKQGKTYTEIQKRVQKNIPKSTISYWCKNICLPLNYNQKILIKNKENLKKARKLAVLSNKKRRREYLNSIKKRNSGLRTALNKRSTALIALTILYLTEGSIKRNASLMFGNSNPFIIDLFLYLLRFCYTIDETKFRCTVQCRADQNTKILEEFWSKITKIPLSQFYKTRIDPRTIGKPTKKSNYKGVCRIDYFSGEIFIELQEIAKIIHKGP